VPQQYLLLSLIYVHKSNRMSTSSVLAVELTVCTSL